MRKTLTAALAAAALAVASSPAAADKLAVSQYGRITQTLPWAVAWEKGMFKEAGLNITEIIPGAGGGTSLRNMLASDLGYAEVATAAALAAIKSGVNLIIVNTASNFIGEIALVSKPGGPVKTLKDLEGRKAGITGPKAMSEIMIRMVLEQQGLSGKVQLVATGGFGPGITALNAGGIDAATLTDPLLTLDAAKYHKVLTFGDSIPRLTWLVGVTTREFAQKNKDKVKALIQVRRRATDYIYANRDEALSIYAKVWEQDRAKVAQYFPKYFSMPDEWSRGNFDAAGLKAMSDGLQLIGEADKPIDWKSIIDQSYLPEDLRRPL